MSDIVRLKTQTQIDNEAAVWTWRLDSGALTEAERRELEGWLRQDFRHRRAFKELGRTWSALDRLAERAQGQKISASAPATRHPFLQPRWYWARAAAAVLVIALGAGLWLAQRPRAQVLATAVGQQRHVTLADGSQITLNTNTLLTVDFTAEHRVVYLRRGEAHFEVTHDAARPFLVHAGDALIRDLGTEFEVRLHPDHDVDVLVSEGRVEVQGAAVVPGQGRPGSGASAADTGWVRALSAGEQLQIAGPHLKMMTVSPRQIEDELAWREGALVFQGEPLSQAIAEVGRYTHTRIVLSGSQVAALRISGRFRTNDVPGFLQALQEALPVRVSRAGPQLIYIAPR
ncbi:MAG: FecR domain-containing protein [Steroidobacteraceae bacterium]